MWGYTHDWSKDQLEAVTDLPKEDLVTEQEDALVLLGEKIILCESRGDLKSCDEKCGCRCGMGLWGFISGTWNETLVRMALADAYMPNRCWQIISLPISVDRHEIVFDAECNYLAGLWLLKTDGDVHWRKYSGSCYLKD